MIEIPPSLLLERNRQLQENARETGLDGLMVFSQAARMMGATSTHGYLRYLLDWTSWGSPSLYFLPVEGNPTLVVPIPGEVEHAREKVPWIQDIRFCNVNDYGKFTCKLLSDRRTTGRIGTLGTQELSYSIVRDLSEHKHEWNFEPAEHLIRLSVGRANRLLKSRAGRKRHRRVRHGGNCARRIGCAPRRHLQADEDLHRDHEASDRGSRRPSRERDPNPDHAQGYSKMGRSSKGAR